MHTAALVQLRAYYRLGITMLLKSEVAPEEIFVKLQAASVEMEHRITLSFVSPKALSTTSTLPTPDV